jgi:hypothetical protein
MNRAKDKVNRCAFAFRKSGRKSHISRRNTRSTAPRNCAVQSRGLHQRRSPTSSPSFPRLEAHKAKTRKHFTHLCLPHHNAHLGRHFLVCSARPFDPPVSVLVCSCSFISQNQRLQKPVFERDKGKPRTLDRVCHKRRCRPHHTHAYNPFEQPRIPA